MFKEKDHIFIRFLDFGLSQTNGFKSEEIQNWYKKEKLSEDEKIICNNFIAEMTKLKSHSGQNKIFISPEYFFNYIDYIELKEARNNSRQAFLLSIVAIILSLASLTYSIFGKIKLEPDTTINISDKSIKEMSKALDK